MEFRNAYARKRQGTQKQDFGIVTFGQTQVEAESGEFGELFSEGSGQDPGDRQERDRDKW